MDTLSEYITVLEYADRWRLSRGAVSYQCRKGQIPGAVKAGKQWRIPIQYLTTPAEVKNGE